MGPPAVTCVIVIHPATPAGAAVTRHRLAAVTAEQLRGEQEERVALRCRCPVVPLYELLALIEQLAGDNGGDPVLHPYIPELIHADVLLVREDPAQAIFIKQPAARSAVPLGVQAGVYILRLFACCVFLKDPANDRSRGRIYLEAAVRALPQPYDRLAQRFELQRRVVVPALHVLAQILGVVFGVAFHDRLQNNALRALRDRLFCIEQPDAAAFQLVFIHSRVVPVPGEAIRFPADHGLEHAALRVPQHALEVWPLVSPTGEGLVYILAHDGEAVPPGKLVTLTQLALYAFLTLATAGVPGVDHGPDQRGAGLRLFCCHYRTVGPACAAGASGIPARAFNSRRKGSKPIGGPTISNERTAGSPLLAV